MTQTLPPAIIGMLPLGATVRLTVRYGLGKTLTHQHLGVLVEADAEEVALTIDNGRHLRPGRGWFHTGDIVNIEVACAQTLTLVDVTTDTEYVPRDELRVGDVIDFWGEPHEIERFVVPSGPAVASGGLSEDRIALADGGAWQMTLRSPVVPVLRRAVA